MNLIRIDKYFGFIAITLCTTYSMIVWPMIIGHTLYQFIYHYIYIYIIISVLFTYKYFIYTNN